MNEFDEFEYADLQNDDRKLEEFEELQTTPNEFVDNHRVVCDFCSNEFDEDDCDKLNGLWVCRRCEEDER